MVLQMLTLQVVAEVVVLVLLVITEIKVQVDLLQAVLVEMELQQVLQDLL
jgi:hypothetical protein